jgi:hypothetical protein
MKQFGIRESRNLPPATKSVYSIKEEVGFSLFKFEPLYWSWKFAKIYKIFLQKSRY